MRNKTPQQQAIVREHDRANALLAEESIRRSTGRPIYKKALFMRLGINPSNHSDGNGTMKTYMDFIQNHPSVWFSTDSLHGGMAAEKVLEFNNAINNGHLVEMYFAIGNVGGGKNEMEYKANILRVESGKKQKPTPDRSLTPSEFIDDEKYIWIKVNDIQKTALTTNDFIVISSVNILAKSIENSEFHFGYIQMKDPS